MHNGGMKEYPRGECHFIRVDQERWFVAREARDRAWWVEKGSMGNGDILLSSDFCCQIPLVVSAWWRLSGVVWCLGGEAVRGRASKELGALRFYLIICIAWKFLVPNSCLRRWFLCWKCVPVEGNLLIIYAGQWVSTLCGTVKKRARGRAVSIPFIEVGRHAYWELLFESTEISEEEV